MDQTDQMSAIDPMSQLSSNVDIKDFNGTGESKQVADLVDDLNKTTATDYESSAAEDLESFNNCARYENAEWALLAYSRTNRLEKLNALLEAKRRKEISLNLNYKGQQKKNYSWTCLHLACYFGHFQVVESILSDEQFRKEINLNIQNNSGDTPLHKATLTNRVHIVQLLLSHGANVFIENCDALLARQLTNNRDILNMLHAAEQNDRNRIKCDLFKAVDNGDLKTLQDYIRTYNNYGELSASADQDEDNQVAINGGEPTTSDNVNGTEPDNGECIQDKNSHDYLKRTDEPLKDMTDERGNTLLHLGAMRGFKAICVYLLEQGLDPHKKNNLGQTCFDLCSNQLKQLFTQVKPTDDRLMRLSKQRITRFEGPLLKKVRILGWRHLYVVLENGVILLYNNKRDSRNKSRRGYKYLESATCELDPNEIGIFTINFSDRSKATFAISSDDLHYYSTLSRIQNSNNHVSSTSDAKSLSAFRNQIELIRQKWFDSLVDHIQYSTDFIRRGLKIDDDDCYYENYSGDKRDSADLVYMNHLIPVDTMKSFVHESRAHYSILERQAALLHDLVQQINSQTSDRYSHQSIDIINDNDISNAQAATGSNATTTTVAASSLATTRKDSSAHLLSTDSNSTGVSESSQASIAKPAPTSRLFGLIKPTAATSSRQYNQLINSTESSGGRKWSNQNNKFAASSPGTNSLGGQATRRQAPGAGVVNPASDFVNEDWHSVLFHLKLLLESAQRTKDSMGHTISLIDHQEQLRQTRLHDLEERCRVLENSLHTLARDHHELEKSVSYSQLHNNSAIARSISMSTDLNEYFDAFDDFDEAERRTLTPGDSMPSDESLNRRIQEVIDDEDARAASNSKGQSRSKASKLFAFYGRLLGGKSSSRKTSDASDTTLEDEEDLQSNCSALTVETLSEMNTAPQNPPDGDQQQQRALIYPNSRTKLPAPMVPRDQISIWSILKNCIGKELYKITMPVVFNEPLTMLQRACECIQYANYLKQADLCDDPTERMELICTFIVSSLAANCHRIIKPFNPLLYETYEITDKLEDGSEVKAVCQQVSHHPPISACYAESDYFVYHGSVNPKIKFWGRTIEILPDGHCRIHLKRRNENYIFKSVSCSLHNIIVGKIWFEHTGPLDVKCPETKITANLDFKQTGWFSNDLHRFDGIIQNEKEKLRYIYGKWSDYMKCAPYSDYEQFVKNNPKKSFTSSGNHSKSDSSQSLDLPNAKTLWRLQDEYLPDYYNFTQYTLRMNELTPELSKSLPRTDSRFRMDVKKLEEGDLDGAANEKERLEEKQRAARAKDKRFKEPSPDFLWFDYVDVDFSKEKFWAYRGDYWENRENVEKFPEIM